MGIEEPGSDEVRAGLNRVLASPEFRSSQRACDFLRYVVEATLSGGADHLKERTIGMDVFGRSAAFEPSDDSSVRVKAGDVRKRLAVYYASPQGSGEPIHIDLPVGSYIPQFHRCEQRSEPAPPTVTAEGATDGLNDLSRRKDSGHSLLQRRLLMASVLALILIGGAATYNHLRSPALPPILAQFWAPVLKSSSPSLILVTPVPIYSRQKPLSEGLPEGKDFLEVPNQYIAVGDLQAEVRIAEFLNQARRPARIIVGDGAGFADLRKSPAILVGFSYNRWKDLNYDSLYSIDPDNEVFFGILKHGAETNWRINVHPDNPNLDEDYAIVSRIFDRDTGQVLVQVSGISHFGTEEAAELITDAKLLEQALHDAPPGWQTKNIQIVLHVRVISKAPAAPTVVATHFW
jgi:hypothetical protein